MKEMLVRLPDATDKETEQIASQLSDERTELQSQLILQLVSPKSKHHQIVVAYLLGLYRMDGAVRDLASVITLEAEVTIQKRERLWDVHPVAEALIKIGRPSIPAMLENIKAAKGEEVTKLSVEVIQYVETPAIAKMILQDAIAKEKDPVKVKILQDSLKYVKKAD
jgi:hypothetical protein